MRSEPNRFLYKHFNPSDQLNAGATFETTRTLKTIQTIHSNKAYDYDGKMIFWDLVGLKLPDICLKGEEKPRKNLTQEACPDRGSNPGPLRDRSACSTTVVMLSENL